MFPPTRDAFMAELSCLQIPKSKPSHFNSLCGHIVPHFQSWNPNVESTENDNEVKTEKDNEIEMNKSISNENKQTNSVKLQQGYTNSGTLNHMVCCVIIKCFSLSFYNNNASQCFAQSTFIVAVLTTPEIEDLIENNILQSAVKKNRPGQGIYIRSLLEMYHQLKYSYQPMQISMLLNAIRTYQKGHWSSIDMKSEYSLAEIIKLLMNEWHNDISNIRQSPLKDIFGIEMRINCTCLTCYNRIHRNELCWQYKIPITNHCFRYWSIIDDTINGTFLFITAEQLVSKGTVDKVFPLVIADIECMDDDEMTSIELYNQHYLKVNGQIKYGVYVTCLKRGNKICAWTAYDWFDKIKQTISYNTQFKYTLVFQKITDVQEITDCHYFDIQQYHVKHTQTYFPKSYPRMKWSAAPTNITHQTYEISSINMDDQDKIHPPQGDSILALAEQLQWTNKHGYLEYLHCCKCNKKSAMMIQKQIEKFNKIIILHLVQYPTQYYEIEWNPNAHVHGLPINKNNQTINVSINGFITAKRKNNITKYATHWRAQNKQAKWNTLCNNKYTQSVNKTARKHACIFFGFRFNHNQ